MMNRFAATLAGLTLRRTCAGSGGPGRSAGDAATAMELSKPVGAGGDESGLAGRTYPRGTYRRRTYR